MLLEDVFQPQNASAVLRTMDCTGIQDAHIVENTNCFEVNRDVALGANKWLTLQTYRDQRELMPEREAQARGLPVGSWKEPGEHYIERAMESLRNRGYRIVATSPHKKGKSPETIDLEAGPLVLLFGTELSGLSEKALKGADEYLHIPMVGFTESYNISVSAALSDVYLAKPLGAEPGGLVDPGGTAEQKSFCNGFDGASGNPD
ncbi:MAG: RNA methyltransferase [Bacteroidales bacterium]